MKYVYRNLKVKSRCVWKHCDKPKSMASNPQVESYALRDVSFHFDNGNCRYMEKTRNATGKAHRQVGAFAVGEACSIDPATRETEITYNPNRCVWAFTTRDGRPVKHCDYLRFDNRGAWATGNITYH
jgi:hypothetical protein